MKKSAFYINFIFLTLSWTTLSSEAADQIPNRDLWGTPIVANVMRTTPVAMTQDASSLDAAVLQLTQNITALVNALTGALQKTQFTSVNSAGETKSGVTSFVDPTALQKAGWIFNPTQNLLVSPDGKLVAFGDRQTGKWYTKDNFDIHSFDELDRTRAVLFPHLPPIRR